MHSQLNYIMIQQRSAGLRAAAENSRWPPADPLVLEDGRRLGIRPIEREDRARLRGLFKRMTPDSRYRRYLSSKPRLTEADLDGLLDIDHYRHEALAAVDEADGSFVGTARYVQSPAQPEVAEVALEVADELHSQGIGTALAVHTIERARTNGVTRLSAITLRNNAPARALLRRLHFRPCRSDGHEIELELEL